MMTPQQREFLGPRPVEAVRLLDDVAQRQHAQAGGKPQDVEWAIAFNAVVLLQARPVTTTAAPAPGCCACA